MSRPARRVVVVCALAALTGVVTLASPSWAEAVGLDFWNVPALRKELAQHVADRELIDRRTDTVLRSDSVKTTLVDELVEGRLTGREIVARFRELNEATGQMDAVREVFPAATDEESVARQVASFVRISLHAQPDRLAEVLRRLEGELDLPGLLSKPGDSMPLPEDPDADAL